MEPEIKFTLKFYFAILTRMVSRPGQFFREENASMSLMQSMGFLVLSSLLFTGAILICRTPENPVIIGGVYLINGVGMAFIAAGIGYGLMVMLAGKQANFTRFFSVVALCSGTTMLISWVPYSLWLTEPWKWWLIATGMTAGMGLRKRETITIIGLLVIILFALFRSLLPMVQLLKMHLGW